MKIKGTFYLKDKIKQVTGTIKKTGFVEKVIFDKPVGKIKSLDILKFRSYEII